MKKETDLMPWEDTNNSQFFLLEQSTPRMSKPKEEFISEQLLSLNPSQKGGSLQKLWR